MRHRLRLFTGEDLPEVFEPPKVSINVAQLTRLLNEAMRADRSWITDFQDDEVEISTDLYEVLSAYLHLRPGA